MDPHVRDHHDAANDLLAPIHERMPVVLAEDAWDTWLDPSVSDVATLERLLAPAPDEWFTVVRGKHRVSTSPTTTMLISWSPRRRRVRRMELSEYLDAITNESVALADAAERGDLDAKVPSCPDWTLAQLVAHIGEVQQWARIIVEQRASERISRRTLPAAPTGADLIPWFRGRVRSSSPHWRRRTLPLRCGPSPTTRPRGFWFRRQAHEVAVHRWDAELATGDPAPIAAELAADGVDEWLGLLRGGGPRGPSAMGKPCTSTAPTPRVSGS